MNQLLVLIGIATAINATARVRKGDTAAVSFVGAGIMLVILGTVGTVWRWDIVWAMATLFLVSSLVLNGQYIIVGLSQLVSGVRTK